MIKPRDKREAVLKKLKEFEKESENANLIETEQAKLKSRKTDLSIIFIKLCMSKFKIQRSQISQLSQDELYEAAEEVYKRSKTPAILQTMFLAGIPLVGWMTFLCSLNGLCIPFYTSSHAFKNLRYFWWYRKAKKKFGDKFIPDPNASN